MEIKSYKSRMDTYGGTLRDLYYFDTIIGVSRGQGKFLKNRFGGCEHIFSPEELVDAILSTFQADTGIQFFNEAFQMDLKNSVMEVMKRHSAQGGGDNEKEHP